MPAALHWPLDELLRACRYYANRVGRKILFEWTLIRGSNDSPEDARRLAALVRGIPAHINVIPLNPTAGFDGASADSDGARRFQAVLLERNVPATIRQRRGIDVAGGCGQLAGGAVAPPILRPVA